MPIGKLQSLSVSKMKMRSSKLQNYIGKRYGKLVVVNVVGVDKCEVWCDCKKRKIVFISNLNKGRTKSCGCSKTENITGKKNHNYKHGDSGSRLYKIFSGMNVRCKNKNRASYKDYGGRGIKVEWLKFEDFKADMSESYDDHCLEYGYLNTSIERMDVNGNYCKSNCRWATKKIQSLNTTRSRRITYKGKTQTLKEWSIELEIPYNVLTARLFPMKPWTVERAFSIK